MTTPARTILPPIDKSPRDPTGDTAVQHLVAAPDVPRHLDATLGEAPELLAAMRLPPRQLRDRYFETYERMHRAVQSERGITSAAEDFLPFGFALAFRSTVDDDGARPVDVDIVHERLDVEPAPVLGDGRACTETATDGDARVILHTEATFTVTEAARLLQCDPSTVTRLAPDLPGAYRVGKQWRLPVAAILERSRA